MDSEYQYDRLPSPTSIRILELEFPATEKISFSIHIVELNTAPPFDALSYTWGDPRSSCLQLLPNRLYDAARFEAECNGKKIMIRPNLRDALLMLQSISFAKIGRSKQRYIWIDALCIDQNNIEERSEQVALMAELYQKAESVIAWLGPEDETTGEAFLVMDRLSSISPEDGFDASHSIYGSVRAEDFVSPESHRSKLGIEPITERDWLSFFVFLHRPYFKRAWVVQEVTLAKSIITVCGSHVFDWQNFSKAIWFIIHTKWYSKLHTEYFRNHFVEPIPPILSLMLPQNLDFGAGAMYLNQTRVGTKKAGKFYSLEALLRNHRYCEATNPCDIIYALQGISNREIRPFNTYGHLMVPDYTVSVAALYTRTARIMMRSYGDLRSLNQREANRWRQTEELPSWVPDYNVKLLPDPLAYRGSNCHWCAEGNLILKMDNRQHDDPLLDVQDILIGSVEAKSERASDTQDWSLLWASFCNIALGLPDYYGFDSEINSTDPNHSTSSQTRVEALWRTLVANTFEGIYPATTVCGEQFLAHVSAVVLKKMAEYKFEKVSFKESIKGRIHSSLYSMFGRSINERVITPWLKLFRSEPEISPYNLEIFTQKVEYMKGRSSQASTGSQVEWAQAMSIFRRELDLTVGARVLFGVDGRILGVGPLETEIGDQVWIIPGAETPFMLRDGKHGRKQLLGEVYIHGLMHGEAVTGKHDLVDIVLE